jgi:hypothetical protein
LDTKQGAILTSGDIALNVASIVLAVFSVSFAGYMVMYGPGDGKDSASKVTVALEPFDKSRAKLGNQDALDPIVTGSIAKTDGFDRGVDHRLVELSKVNQRLQYNLRTVFQDTAFVDVTNGRSIVTLPIEKGALLPGAGRVVRFERRSDKWVLITTSAEISEDGILTFR